MTCPAAFPFLSLHQRLQVHAQPPQDAEPHSAGTTAATEDSMAELEYVPLEKKKRLEGVLLQNMRQHAPELRRVLEDVNSEWCYEDPLDCYSHQSFKVFDLQNATQEMADALAAIAPEGRPFCRFFEEILQQGTVREFSPADNRHCLERAAPIAQAFFHARYFVEMAVKYGAALADPPQPMPSGWAALLCLYGLR